MITFASALTPVLTLLKLGDGLPLQKFDNVQLAFLVKLEPASELLSIVAIGSTALAEITMSLIFGLSPAMFPRPQIAYSTTSMLGDYSKSTRTYIVPFSMSTCTWSFDPLARLVRHQAASNWSLGRSPL